MPLCVMLSILFIFGWRGVVPFYAGCFAPICGTFISLFYNRRHDRQPGVCSPVCLCNITWQLGTRWRYGLTSRYVWQRLSGLVWWRRLASNAACILWEIL